jgi:hypothetical protein
MLDARHATDDSRSAVNDDRRLSARLFSPDAFRPTTSERAGDRRVETMAF